VAYVYRTDTRSASSYQALLQDNGFAVRLVHTGEVTATNWSKYNLLVVGVDSGTGYHWFGGLAGARRVAEYSVPVIGNGEGGASFFQQLGLNINWGGAAVNYSSSAAEVLNAAHPAWTAPYLVPIVRGQVRTYASPGAAVETYGPSSVPILRIGRDPASPAYYPIAQQTDAKGLPQPYLLWGWYRSPDFMTTQGRWVYVNLAWYMKR